MSRPLYDISPPLTAETAVWPGDSSLRRQVLLDLERGDSITLSTLTATVHLGSHADAPSHYGQGREGIDRRSLEPYLGPCQVIAVEVEPGGRIRPEHLHGPIEAPRVLFRTGSFPDPAVFNSDFVSLSPDLIEHLVAHGVQLVGLDTPSVDPVDSKDLPSHQACLRHDLAILEGLVLSEVPEGRYELIALPLKLLDFDASPVRAVLRTLADQDPKP